jgi:hypothetical protein
VSIDHADQLSAETMRIMREKHIFAVPTFTISDYFAEHAVSPEQAGARRASLEYPAREFRKQVAAGVPVAMGSDVGPFPHATQAREFALMVKYGMTPARGTAGGHGQRGGAARLGRQDRAAEAGVFRGCGGGAGESAAGYRGARAGPVRDENGVVIRGR